MIILQANQLERHYGATQIFKDITLHIQNKDRLALVGRNGSGKSTLLKIIAGIEQPDTGSVSVAKNIHIGYLAQRTGLISDQTIWNEMLEVFEEVIAMEKRMRTVEASFSDPRLLEDEQLFQETLNLYDRLQEEFKTRNGYGYLSEIKSILHGFGFYEEDYNRSITELSGGQKTRLALAKLLLESPDLLILDEPTNHLDVDTLTWLEGYLRNYRGALLIVSHDRYFLDQLVQEVYEISLGRIHFYPGNYTNYLIQKEKRIEQAENAFEKQQKEIARQEEFIEKNIAHARTSKRAQSRRKQLDKIERIEKPLVDRRSANFTFTINEDSGDLVLQVKNATIGYDGQATATNINLDAKKRDIIAVVGPNGIGKSTLLKTIIKEIPALSGEFYYGAKVDIGYYDQEQSALDHSKTILNELWDEHPTLPEVQIRSLLGSFLFTGDDVKKTIGSLSGGEKSRVALAKLALNHNNFLILDEPTNHLDIDSKEVLENALDDFEGTILFVSHDRYFINRLANKVIELGADGSVLYLGDYDYYIEKKAEQEAIEAALHQKETQDTANTTEIPTESELDREVLKEYQRLERRLKRELEAVEKNMEQRTTEIKNIEQQLMQPEVYNDPKISFELSEQLQSAKEIYEQNSEEWIEISLEIEHLEEPS